MRILFFILTITLAISQASVYGQETNKTKPVAMKIGMTSIYVNDPVKAFAFYTDTLGFAEIHFNPEAKLAVVASPEDPEGTSLLLEPNDHPAAKTYQQDLYKEGLPAIVFFTEDINETYEKLSHQGVHFKSKPRETDWGIIAFFDDGFGNWIQLMEEKKQ